MLGVGGDRRRLSVVITVVTLIIGFVIIVLAIITIVRGGIGSR